MNKITITTPENIEIEYRLAGAGSRTASAMIDFLFQLLIALVIVVPYFWTKKLSLDSVQGFDAALLIITFFIIFFCYFIITEMIMKGQSIGKKILKLRVIRENGQPVTFFRSLIRNTFRYFIDFSGIGVIVMFFSKKCMRVGDMVARTIVVSEHADQIDVAKLSYTNFSTTDANLSEQKELLTSEKFKLTEYELRLTQEYFNKKHDFPDPEAAKKLMLTYFTKKFEFEEGRLSEEDVSRLIRMNLA